MNPLRAYHLPAILWAVLVAILLAGPAPPMPPSSSWLPESILPWIDKLVHAFLFLILAVLTLRSVRVVSRVGRPGIFTAVVSFGFGLVLELVQILIPSRGFEREDLVANALGVVLGLTGAAVYRFWSGTGD